MTDSFLGRSDAPFAENVWQRIDDIVTEAAKSQLSARRILYLEGPFGLGFKSFPGPDRVIRDDLDKGGTAVATSDVLPLIDIQTAFTLSARDVAAFEQTGIFPDSGAIAAAALAAARKEDEVLFNGVAEAGIRGLVNADGVQSFKLASWDKVGTAAENLINAANLLDAAGFHGPYAVALSPALYNTLFRLYPQGNLTELQHLQTFITDGIVKAPGLASGGILLASGRQFASILVGQDLATGFVGPKGKSFEFVVSESIALRLIQPRAIVVLQT